MRITPFAISGLLAGIASFCFGFLVLLKSANKKLGRTWCLFTLSAGIWGFGGFWIGTTNSAESALAAWRFAFQFGVIWMPPLLFHFVLEFCELKKPKTLLIHYLISILFFLLTPTHYFYTSVRWIWSSLYFPQHAWPFIAFTIWWFGAIIHCHWLLWKTYRTADPRKKGQIKYFFLGTAVGYLGGSSTYLPHYGIDLYPGGNFTVFLYPLIMSYAIIKFNLMDIRVLVRRTALIVALYVGLLVASAPVLYLFHRAHLAGHSAWSQPTEVLIVSLILSTGPFLYAFVVKRNSYFQDYALASLTHELKSPLAVIESALDFLNNTPDLKNADPTQMSSYLQMIQRNSTRLQTFVNDLLRAFQIQGQDVAMTKEAVDLANIARKSLASYMPMAESKNITMTMTVRSSEIKIFCDGIKIEQVFSNLLSNAIKFTEKGKIHLSLENSKNDIRACVSDSGFGIPSEELPYIFDRFFQGHIGRSRKGTGIGLTIAQLWVEAHGGKIWAESEGEGKGTTVTFTLPV